MKFRFADYILDTNRRELHRGSEPIAAGPQVLYLLVLVQNGLALIKEEDRCALVIIAVFSRRRMEEAKWV